MIMKIKTNMKIDTVTTIMTIKLLYKKMLSKKERKTKKIRSISRNSILQDKFSPTNKIMNCFKKCLKIKTTN